MNHFLTYFRAGWLMPIPNELWFTYILKVLKYLFASFIITLYFSASYTVLTMVIAVLLADLIFYVEVQQYLDLLYAEQNSTFDEDVD